MTLRYRDRAEAGTVLAAQLLTRLSGESAARQSPLVVLGLPRGGVPVAEVVARELDAPLDVLVVRKVGVPWQPEVAMGAIASIGDRLVTVRNADVIGHVADAERAFAQIASQEKRELERRIAEYRQGRGPLEVEGRTVVLVDDGLATGATMRAAVEAVRGAHPARVIVAVPICAADTVSELAEVADEVVCAWTPDAFWAVGQGYHDFSQTSDDEVRAILAENPPPG